MSSEFDLAVIGAGPGGYVAAIRAAQLGLRVACIDAWRSPSGGPALGGTCTNVGCIPSKALLQSSENYVQLVHEFADHGIVCPSPAVDLERMQARKAKVVRQNNEGISYLFKKNKVEFVHGRASFRERTPGGSWELAVAPGDGIVRARHVIVATGSNPRALAGVAFDEQRILSNSGALAMERVPQRLGVIGAGVIGLELGSVWRRLGAEVTLLEALPTFLPVADEQIAREAFKTFTKQGLKIELGVRIEEVKADERAVRVRFCDAAAADQARTLEFERLIVSVGRAPNTDGLEAQRVGLTMDERGCIVVDEHCATNLPGVWAIGDVVRGPMLAHKAEEEGVAVAERIAGGAGHVDLATIPNVVYTDPEIAWVGQTEAQLKAVGRAYRAGSFPFAANGRARAAGHTLGFVKMLADSATDEILGVHMIGPGVSELISEAVVAMSFRASSEDLARICHAHPTLSEAVREAALAVDRRTLNA
ncbi:MAG TPA: dihydrolipoyl dehydrogenase [Burkholderiaceae bacterium]|nr:dihydrolipoyl dehydrogenase [Burkholderiaceae bacterium]